MTTTMTMHMAPIFFLFFIDTSVQCFSVIETDMKRSQNYLLMYNTIAVIINILTIFKQARSHHQRLPIDRVNLLKKGGVHTREDRLLI